MFSYETNGKIQGLLLSYDGIYDYELSAYSVEKDEFKKQLMKRRFIASGIILTLVTLPSVLIPMGGDMMGLGIMIAVFSGIGLLFGGLDEIINLFRKNSLLLKHSTGHSHGSTYILENTDNNKIYQRTYSKIFAKNGNTVFWFKFFKLEDEKLLREATEILLAEENLRKIVKKSDDYRVMVDQSDDNDVAFIGKRSEDNLLVLEGKFNDFKEDVMKSQVEHGFDIDEIMEMAVKVKF